MRTCTSCGHQFKSKRGHSACAKCRESAAYRRTGEVFDHDPAGRVFGHTQFKDQGQQRRWREMYDENGKLKSPTAGEEGAA